MRMEEVTWRKEWKMKVNWLRSLPHSVYGCISSLWSSYSLYRMRTRSIHSSRTIEGIQVLHAYFPRWKLMRDWIQDILRYWMGDVSYITFHRSLLQCYCCLVNDLHRICKLKRISSSKDSSFRQFPAKWMLIRHVITIGIKLVGSCIQIS